MTLMVHGIITANKNLGAVTVSGVSIEVPANSIAIYLIDPAATYRQNEIISAWKWLYNGIRDRNLLDDQFAGAVLYTAVPLGETVSPKRKTSSVFADIAAGDAGLGISVETATLFHGAVIPLETAFRKLYNVALESTLKAA